jgi:hypothetical protein
MGIGVNTGILDYQFGSLMDAAFCGVPMNASCAPNAPYATDCAKCPCQRLGCNNVAGPEGCCDYGFARTHTSAFGPNGGNRYGNIKWG